MDEYLEHANALADALDAAIPGWVERSVARRVTAWQGTMPQEVGAAAAEAGRAALAEVGPKLRSLLGADIDEQWTTPLVLLRSAVRYPAQVLHDAGVPPVPRERFTEEAFPLDAYDLSPATLADVDPSLHDLGLAWGAAKALAHRRRHLG